MFVFKYKYTYTGGGSYLSEIHFNLSCFALFACSFVWLLNLQPIVSRESTDTHSHIPKEHLVRGWAGAASACISIYLLEEVRASERVHTTLPVLCAHRIVCYTSWFTRAPKGVCLSAPILSPLTKFPRLLSSLGFPSTSHKYLYPGIVGSDGNFSRRETYA